MAASAPADTGSVVSSTAGLTILVLCACLGTLALTPVLPFVDFYAHIARYYILANIGSDPLLEENYDAAWQMLPNLGMDILGTGLMGLLPPLVAAKVIAAATMAMPFIGVVALARVLHGRVPPFSIFLAGILVFNHILIWGFANFLLGFGLSLCGLALWIGMTDRPWLRWALSAILAVMLFFVHGLAFAIWGLLLGTVELMLAYAARDLRPLALLRRMAVLASLAIVPALLFTQMPTSEASDGVTAAFANLASHAAAGSLWPEILDEIWQRIDTFLRVADSGHPRLDRLLGVILWGGLVAGYLSGALRLDPRLWLAAGLALILVLFMPPNMFGVGYVNDRAPLVLLGLLAAGSATVAGTRPEQVLASGVAVLFLVRLALVGTAWASDGQVYRDYLAALRAHPDTGRIGVPVFFDGTGERDVSVSSCKPLSFLLLLENGTAVPTFAFGTQQPLRLDGPLAQAARGAALAPHAPKLGHTPADQREKTLVDMAAVGFDTIISCDTGSVAPPPTQLSEIAGNGPWRLYARVAP